MSPFSYLPLDCSPVIQNTSMTDCDHQTNYRYTQILVSISTLRIVFTIADTVPTY